MKFISTLIAALLIFSAVAVPPLHAAGCAKAARALNQRLPEKIDEDELALMLNALNASRNARLPEKFLTKREAQQSGWRPGRGLWDIPALHGKSIGGDRFGNREGRLPRGNWREADLDYRGGRRNAKRLLFSSDGRRWLTVDHYQTFSEIPECR